MSTMTREFNEALKLIDAELDTLETCAYPDATRGQLLAATSVMLAKQAGIKLKESPFNIWPVGVDMLHQMHNLTTDGDDNQLSLSAAIIIDEMIRQQNDEKTEANNKLTAQLCAFDINDRVAFISRLDNKWRLGIVTEDACGIRVIEVEQDHYDHEDIAEIFTTPIKSNQEL